MFDLFPVIAARADQKSGSLSGCEAQMVAFGRALAQRPNLILLDEPTTGPLQKYVDLLFHQVREIHNIGNVGFLLAEQNAVKALQVANRVLVLSLGSTFMIVASEEADTERIKAGYHI